MARCFIIHFTGPHRDAKSVRCAKNLNVLRLTRVGASGRRGHFSCIPFFLVPRDLNLPDSAREVDQFREQSALRSAGRGGPKSHCIKRKKNHSNCNNLAVPGCSASASLMATRCTREKLWKWVTPALPPLSLFQKLSWRGEVETNILFCGNNKPLGWNKLF